MASEDTQDKTIVNKVFYMQKCIEMSCPRQEIFINYERLYELLAFRSEPSNVRDFLETFLVLHGAREGSIMRVKSENIRELNTIAEKHNLVFLPYAFPNSEPYADNSKLVLVKLIKGQGDIVKTRRELDAIEKKGDAHIKIGEHIGYFTPLNINSRNRSKPALSASLNVTVEYNGDIHTVQLVPQIIVNKTRKEIEEYYKPFMDCLPTVYRVTPFKILDIQLNIDSLRGGTRKRRKN